MSPDLGGKTALVTGARHGIGEAAALALAARGAHVSVCGRATGDCDAVVSKIAENGGEAFDHALDVGALDTVAGRIEGAVERLGGLDILVNNAAVIAPMAPIAELDPVEFDRAMRINVSSAAAVTTGAWPHLAGHGRIVNLLSGAALRPLHGWAAYCSSKAALLMLTRATDLEGRDKGIRCFGFAPGLVDTQMQAAIREAGINEISEIPRTNLTHPSEAGTFIAWLSSGQLDAYAGSMVDSRDEELREIIEER